MDAKIYFPQVDPDRPGVAELRACVANGGGASEAGIEITSVPPAGKLNGVEKTTALRAVHALRAWERSGPTEAVSIILDSEFPSEGTSCQLAVAAADWLFRHPGAKPKYHLVATGALPEINAARVASLSVLPVDQVGQKAEQLLKDLKTDKLAGAPVLFCYPAANSSEPGLMEVLARFPKQRAIALPVRDFGELILAWAPDAGKAAARSKPKGGASWSLARVSGAALVFAGFIGAAMTPGVIEPAVALVTNVDRQTRALSETAKRSPDHPTQGCAALLGQAMEAPIAPGFGRSSVLASIEACQALTVCDLRASSPMERPEGVRLSQMTARRDQLDEARAACARAAAAFPGVGRLPFQLARALEAGNEPALRPAAREARSRALELGHPMATVELLREQARHEPELVRARLQLLSQGQEAHPEALVTLGELLACAQLPMAGQARGGAPAPSDLRDAADLFARLPTLPAAARMSSDLRAEMASVERSIRQAMLANPPVRPSWCQRVVASVGG